MTGRRSTGDTTATLMTIVGMKTRSSIVPSGLRPVVAKILTGCQMFVHISAALTFIANTVRKISNLKIHSFVLQLGRNKIATSPVICAPIRLTKEVIVSTLEPHWVAATRQPLEEWVGTVANHVGYALALLKSQLHQ